MPSALFKGIRRGRGRPLVAPGRGGEIGAMRLRRSGAPRRRRAGWRAGLALLCAGCAAPAVEPAQPVSVAPAAGHQVALPSADSLAGWLRAGSAAGPLLSAHRGGPVDDLPENALVTFARTVALAPALLETDVRLTADGALVLLHDETLERTTTGRGPLAATTLAQLRELRLVAPSGRVTGERVPTLDEALRWAAGRAVLALDVKREVPYARVVEAVRAAGAGNRVVIIVYTHAQLLEVHRLAPELVISFTAGSAADVARAVAAGVPARRLIGFLGVGTLDIGAVAALRAHGIRGQLGTFGALDSLAAARGEAVYRALATLGVEVIATDSVARAARALGY